MIRKLSLLLFLLTTPGFAHSPTTISDAPSSGSTGTMVTITGANLITTAEDNLVRFGAGKSAVRASASTLPSATIQTAATYRTIIVNNTGNPATLTDYSVLVVVNTATPVAQGKMNADGSDIRFTTDYVNDLSYWIDPGIQNEYGINRDSTHIWVKMPVIAGSGGTTMYMSYGNPSAVARSNIGTTFLFGDDFDDNTLDAAKWQLVYDNQGQIIEQNQRLEHNSPQTTPQSNSYLYSKQQFTGPIVLEMQFKKGGYIYRMAGLNRDIGNWYNSAFCQWQDWGSFSAQTNVKGAATDANFRNDSWSTSYNPEYYLKIIRRPDSTFSYDLKVPSFEPGGPQAWSTTISDKKMRLDSALKVFAYDGVWASSSLPRYEDNIRVRKYSSPEPFAAVSAEQTAPAIISFAPTSGPIGTPVTITGMNFSTTAASNIVYFGGVRATVTSATSTSLAVTVPKGATFQPITVTVSGSTASSSSPFIVTFSGGGSITSTSFATKVDFATGSFATHVAFGDVDGDGKLDMAVANSTGATISVLRNASISGTPSFATKVDFGTGTTPNHVAFGDVDGDGLLDAVVANYNSNTISILRNTSTSGTVSFATKVDYATGTNPKCVAIGDLDGDGKPDIVVTNYNANTISVFRNTSTSGTVSFATKVDVLAGSSPFGVAIGEMDGDGKLDVAVANYAGSTVSVFRNTSTSGTLSFATKADYGTGFNPFYVAIGDVDGDGKLDLVAQNSGSSTVSVLRNTSTIGLLSFATKLDYATGSSPYGLAIGGMDGDGKPDIVIVNAGDNTISVLANTSSSGRVSFATKVDYTGGSPPQQNVAIGDIDGDGKLDIATVNGSSNTVSVFRNSIVSTPLITFRVNMSVKMREQTFRPDLGDIVTVPGAFNTWNIAADTLRDLDGDSIYTKLIALAPGRIEYKYYKTTRGGLDWEGDFRDSATVVNRVFYVPANDASTRLVFFDNDSVYNAPTAPSVPAISSFSPTSGPIGASVTITGTNFNTAAASNIVYFGAVKATVSAATSTSLTVTVPTGTTYEPISVTDTTTHLTGYSSRPFVITFASNRVIDATSFNAKVDFTAGTSPYGMDAGDLDGDGKSDLVVTNFNSNVVSIFRNTGTSGSIITSSFAAKVDFTTGTNPGRVAVGDLDGDGKPDLVVTNNSSNTVSVFRNTSTSGSITTTSFAAKVDFVTGTTPVSIAIGDVDGDGKPDLVLANNGSNTVSVFRNTSISGSITTSSFAPKVDFATGSGPQFVAMADIDGDGKPDLVAVNAGGNSISVLRNTSSSGSITTGSFAAKVDFATGTSPFALALGDVDGDGKPDIVVSNSGSNTVSILRNTSTLGSVSLSSFAAKVDFTTGTNPGGVALGDIDGDGKPDVVVANGGGGTGTTMTAFRNTSTSGSITAGSLASGISFTAGTYPISVVIGDFDGDGKPDLGATNFSSNTVSVLRNTILTVVVPPTISSFTPTSGPIGTTVTITGTNFNTTPTNNVVYVGGVKASVTFASANSLNVTVPTGAMFEPITVTDTTTDLTAYSNAPFVVTFSSARVIDATSFASKVDFTAGTAPYGIDAGDLDGDGKADIVAANAGSNTISVFRNTGTSGSMTTGSFGAKVDFATGTSPVIVTIGDVNGDGKSDLVVTNSNSNTVSILRNTSVSGTISTSSFSAKVDFATGTKPGRVAIRDVDGDGKPDLVVTNNTDNTVSVFRNIGTSGSLTSSSFAPKVDFATGTNPMDVAVGDLDGDGKPDLVVTNAGSNSISVLRNTSTSGSITAGSFAAKVDITAGTNPAGLVLGDIDGDGKLDIVVTNNASNSVSIFRNISTSGSISSSSFAAKVDFTTGTNPGGVTLGDIDGDGKPDVVAANGGGGTGTTITAFRNSSTSGSITTSSLASGISFTTGTYPINVVIGDFDGDGKPDVAATNFASNTVSVLRNTVAAGTAPGTPTLTSPATGATNQATTLTLAWSAGAGGAATSYDLRVSPNVSFVPLAFVDSNITTGTSQSVKGLANNTRYYWKVRASNGGGVSNYSTTFSFTTIATATVTISSPITFPDNPTVSTEYKLVSFPMNTSGVILGPILPGNTPDDWIMFRDNGATTNFYTSLTSSSTLSSGEGYWLIKHGFYTPSITGSQMAVGTDGNVVINLHTGWNIIGVPFDASVQWSTVKTANSLPTAVLYSYNATATYAQVTQMDPFKGYYFDNRTASLAQLKIPYPFPASTIPPTVETTYDWKIQLTFESDINQDAENIIGVAPGAKNGYDELDTRKPPLFMDQGFLYFSRPEWDEEFNRFNGDIRADIGDGQVWEFEVSNPRKSMGTIRLNGVSTVPAQYEVKLVNLDNTTPIDVRAQEAYTFQSVKEKTKFKLVVGKRAYVEDEMKKYIPSSFALYQNYPNPFNPSTTISFALPKESTVKLEVANILGQLVAVIAQGTYAAGVHSLVWDASSGKDGITPSGVYFSRLMVDGALIQSQKMILTK